MTDSTPYLGTAKLTDWSHSDTMSTNAPEIFGQTPNEIIYANTVECRSELKMTFTSRDSKPFVVGGWGNHPDVRYLPVMVFVTVVHRVGKPTSDAYFDVRAHPLLKSGKTGRVVKHIGWGLPDDLTTELYDLIRPYLVPPMAL